MEASTPPRVTQPAQRNLLQDSGDSNPGSVTTQKGVKGWEVWGRLQMERTLVYLWLTHVEAVDLLWSNLPSIKNKLKKKKKKPLMMEIGMYFGSPTSWGVCHLVGVVYNATYCCCSKCQDPETLFRWSLFKPPVQEDSRQGVINIAFMQLSYKIWRLDLLHFYSINKSAICLF